MFFFLSSFFYRFENYKYKLLCYDKEENKYNSSSPEEAFLLKIMEKSSFSYETLKNKFESENLNFPESFFQLGLKNNWINRGTEKKDKNLEVLDDISFNDFKNFINRLPNTHYKTPLNVSFDITNYCNLNCMHCCNDSGANKDKTLTLDEILGVIDQCSDMKVFDVIFAGGEPFLRKDFFQILKYASGKIPKPTFSTNGSTIDEKSISQLKDIGIDRVQVSLDGFKETHDRIRGKRNYEDALNAIKLFAKNKFNTHVQTTVIKENIDEIPDLCSYLVENFEISKYKFTPLSVVGRASQEMKVGPEEYKQLYDEIIDLAFKYSKNSKSSVKTRLMFDYIGRNIPGSKDYVCEAFRECLSINYSGDVYPCSFLPIKIGNIREETIDEIWNNPP